MLSRNSQRQPSCKAQPSAASSTSCRQCRRSAPPAPRLPRLQQLPRGGKPAAASRGSLATRGNHSVAGSSHQQLLAGRNQRLLAYLCHPVQRRGCSSSLCRGKAVVSATFARAASKPLSGTAAVSCRGRPQAQQQEQGSPLTSIWEGFCLREIAAQPAGQAQQGMPGWHAAAAAATAAPAPARPPAFGFPGMRCGCRRWALASGLARSMR